jgi:hypothetical protein
LPWVYTEGGVLDRVSDVVNYLNEGEQMNIRLGVEAKDIVTGFTGIVTARATYLTGCDQYVLSPGVDDDGKVPEAHWFDENRLVVIGPGVVEDMKPAKTKPVSEKKGGPQTNTPPIK